MGEEVAEGSCPFGCSVGTEGKRGQDGGPHSLLVTSVLAASSQDTFCVSHIQELEGFSLSYAVYLAFAVRPERASEVSLVPSAAWPHGSFSRVPYPLLDLKLSSEPQRNQCFLTVLSKSGMVLVIVTRTW